MSDWWTNDRIERLKHLWIVEGYSAAQIAQHFNGEVSRSAVCAKVARLKIHKNGPGPRPLRTVAPQAPKLHVVKPPEIETQAALSADGQPITFLNAEPHHCRYPIGDPLESDFHVCGQPRQEGSSYCAYHHAKCWIKVQSRKRGNRSDAIKLARDAGMQRAFGT